MIRKLIYTIGMIIVGGLFAAVCYTQGYDWHWYTVIGAAGMIISVAWVWFGPAPARESP